MHAGEVAVRPTLAAACGPGSAHKHMSPGCMAATRPSLLSLPVFSAPSRASGLSLMLPSHRGLPGPPSFSPPLLISAHSSYSWGSGRGPTSPEGLSSMACLTHQEASHTTHTTSHVCETDVETQQNPQSQSS